MVLRSNETQLESLLTTIQEKNREIFLIRAKLDTNAKIFSNLKTNLVDCIKKANLELDEEQPLQLLVESDPVLAQNDGAVQERN